MLEFTPQFYPWTPISLGITQELPPGRFYTNADNRLPRSSKPAKFLLITDRSDPVDIIRDGKIIKTIRPRATATTVEINLLPPPSGNLLTIRNGVDEPVHLSVASTYMYTILEAAAREIFEYSGRTTDNFAERIYSPWSSFFIEYLLPWRREGLPDVRSLRILSVKMLANTLINASGTQGGVMDLISAFSASTAAVVEAKNPPQWEMDLHQPVTSGDDTAGFEAHVWIPNLCFANWLTFIKLINNVKDYYTLIKVSEAAVTVQQDGTDLYTEHRFSSKRSHCSVRGLIEFLGCMEQAVVVGAMHLISEVPICAWGLPFDQVVEHPGIGGKHFDSGVDFDGDFGPFDGTYDIDQLTDRWVGVSTKNALDHDSCLDTFPTLSSVPTSSANCCKEGPDTVNLNTMVLEQSVEHTAPQPNHPVYGGDASGLLDNPYFNALG